MTLTPGLVPNHSLNMEVASPVQQGQYTILRIKRKRNEEPLDALGMMLSIAEEREEGYNTLLLSRRGQAPEEEIEGCGGIPVCTDSRE